MTMLRQRTHLFNSVIYFPFAVSSVAADSGGFSDFLQELMPHISGTLDETAFAVDQMISKIGSAGTNEMHDQGTRLIQFERYLWYPIIINQKVRQTLSELHQICTLSVRHQPDFRFL